VPESVMTVTIRDRNGQNSLGFQLCLSTGSQRNKCRIGMHSIDLPTLQLHGQKRRINRVKGLEHQGF
jgi:hypothetical protein